MTEQSIWTTLGEHPIEHRFNLGEHAIERRDITIFNYEVRLTDMYAADPTTMLLIDIGDPTIPFEYIDGDAPLPPRFLQVGRDDVVPLALRDQLSWIVISRPCLPEVVYALNFCDRILAVHMAGPSPYEDVLLALVSDPLVIVEPSEEIQRARREWSERAAREHAEMKATETNRTLRKAGLTLTAKVTGRRAPKVDR
jgi:hypothetical protein